MSGNGPRQPSTVVIGGGTLPIQPVQQAASDQRPARVEIGAGSKLGSYIVVKLLGQGAMGAVYEANHETLGRRAAVKVLLPSIADNAQARARFLREGQAASRIHHPNIVDVYDVGTFHEVPFLVMELLEGEDMGALLVREAPLAQERLLDLMIPVLCALAAAHDRGIVHRDLKPANIFLHKSTRGLSPKIVDFGISKMLDLQSALQTASSSLLGTPCYMSPEQVQDSSTIDAHSDQFSAGVVIYEAITGRKPFQATSLNMLLSAILGGHHTPIRELVPDIAPVLAEAVERAIHVEPGKRFPSVRHLARQLMPLCSERTRLLYATEVEIPSDVPSGSSPPAEVSPSGSGSSLAPSGQPVGERPKKSSMGNLLLYGLVLLLGLAAVGAGVWFFKAKEQTVLSPVSSTTGLTAPSTSVPSRPR